MVRRLFRRNTSDEMPEVEQDEAAFAERALDDDEPLAVPASEPEFEAAEAGPTRLSVRWPGVALLVALVVGVALATAGQDNAMPPELLTRWPWLLVIGGVLWLLVGLVTGWAHGTLGGPLVAVTGLVALLPAQGTLANMMVVSGTALMALGAAVILRGFTMPRA